MGGQIDQGTFMSITVFIRYELDPFKTAEFETYSKRWLDIIPRLGGNRLLDAA